MIDLLLQLTRGSEDSWKIPGLERSCSLGEHFSFSIADIFRVSPTFACFFAICSVFPTFAGALNTMALAMNESKGGR